MCLVMEAGGRGEEAMGGEDSVVKVTGEVRATRRERRVGICDYNNSFSISVVVAFLIFLNSCCTRLRNPVYSYRALLACSVLVFIEVY